MSAAIADKNGFGIQLNRQDAGIFVDILIDRYPTGVKFMPPHGWTYSHDLRITNAQVGIHFTTPISPPSGPLMSFLNGLHPQSNFLAINQYGPDQFCERRLRFIEENQGRLFFLYYPMALVHAPQTPPPDAPG